MLRSSIVRSIMEVGQKHINFGTLEKSEQRKKTIVVRNNSEAPLIYSIKKSGLISSGDLVIREGRVGIIRGYGKKEVEFTFEPTMPGIFHEKLVIENVQDPENDQTINVKAIIRKPSNFFLQSLTIDFGTCLINETCSNVQEIIISNTSQKQSRTFQLKLDTSSFSLKGAIPLVTFELLDSVDEDYFEEVPVRIDGEGENDISLVLRKTRRKRPMVLLSTEAEEQIELLEQKLKIAKRKGHKEKVRKLESKLERLRSGIVGDDYARADDSVKPEQEDEEEYFDTFEYEVPSPSETAPSPSLTAPVSNKKSENSMIVVLEPRQIRTVAVSFRAVEVKRGIENFSLNGSESMRTLKSALDSLADVDSNEKSSTVAGNIFVHELRNTDAVKLVCYEFLTTRSAFVHLCAMIIPLIWRRLNLIKSRNYLL